MTRIWKHRGLAEIRRNTEFFIDDSPSTIRLIPNQRVERAGGTYSFEPQKPRRAQDFRLIPVGNNMSDGIERVEGMDISKWTFHLIGAHNCEMEVGDTWTWRGIQYRIISLLPENNWERRALVTIFGKAPPENIPPSVRRADQILGPRWKPPGMEEVSNGG